MALSKIRNPKRQVRFVAANISVPVPAAGTLARMERFQLCSLSAAKCELLRSTHQVVWPRNLALRELLSGHRPSHRLSSFENPFDQKSAVVRWCRGQWGLWTFCEPVVVPTACARSSSWWPRLQWLEDFHRFSWISYVLGPGSILWGFPNQDPQNGCL